MKFFATAPFSLEKPVKLELEKLNINVLNVAEGKVYFEATVDEVAHAMVNLRCADRVYLLVAEFTAKTFDELFDNIARIKWQNYVSKNGKINVSATCARSQLMSRSDVQKIVKKAIVKALGLKILPENKEKYPIDVHINRDNVCIAIDCCGQGLHKRGYRVKNAEAPLRETFASGLISLAGYRRAKVLVDPFCGSGTIPIEAAMYALNIAPNANRKFVCEEFINFKSFDFARAQAKAKQIDCDVKIYASDISPQMCDLTRYHAQRAGVDKYIKVSCLTASKVLPTEESGIIITNPPYGIRLEDKTIASEIRALCQNFNLWQKYILTANKNIEREIGIFSNKKRRVYNGNIECNFLLFENNKK